MQMNSVQLVEASFPVYITLQNRNQRVNTLSSTGQHDKQSEQKNEVT